MSPPDTPATNSNAIKTLRSDIRDLGDEVDAYQAKTALAMGAGVFLLLLGLGGLYDLINHNTSVRGALGISQVTFTFVVIVLSGTGAVLMLLGLFRRWRRDLERESRLVRMQEELARLESESHF